MSDLDQHITNAATRAKVSYLNGNDIDGDYWAEYAQRVSDQREAMRAEFDVLKGHPDHSGRCDG